MIKVDFDSSFEVGDIVTQDPLYGTFFIVRDVVGSTHTLTVHTKGECVLEKGDTLVKIVNFIGEFSPVGSIAPKAIELKITKIHEDGK